MSITLVYNDWEDLDKVEKDVIKGIDKVTAYAEDLDKGYVKVTIEYLGKTLEEDLKDMIQISER